MHVQVQQLGVAAALSLLAALGQPDLKAAYAQEDFKADPIDRYTSAPSDVQSVSPQQQQRNERQLQGNQAAGDDGSPFRGDQGQATSGRPALGTK